VAVPANDYPVIINQVITTSDQPAYRANMEHAFTKTLAMAPRLADRVAEAERVERFRFTRDTPGFFRVPGGPGWALLGDAGYHKDPVTAQGIVDAFRDAELMAVAIDGGLEDGPAGLDRALLEYQTARDRTALSMYGFTCHLAQVDQPSDPTVARLFHALSGNPAGTSRFLGIMAGSAPFNEFMNPANLNTILAQAA
jgi:2-polyprenyl-6-methoxyphenol hydroxylase-like FAD-dependent oxidoreductase